MSDRKSEASKNSTPQQKRPPVDARPKSDIVNENFSHITTTKKEENGQGN